ncbi:MAG: hypothetical protein PHX68_04080 [Alphaproteobacteria bacterium]|nr:hypothetical protein [Alphaproteobacteria bacterium]
MNNIDPGIFEIMVQTATSASTILMLMAVLGFVFLTIVLVTKLADWVLPKPKETQVSDFLPFNRLNEDGATIHLRNGGLARVYEIQGADTTLILPEERAGFMEMRKRWVDAMAELEVVSRIITIRERVDLSEENTYRDEPLLEAISKKWLENLYRIYKNKHYIVLSVNDRLNAEKDLNQAGMATTSILETYQPVLISEKTAQMHDDKSPLWVFAQICSPMSNPKPVVRGETGEYLNALLTADYIHFTKDEGIIKFLSGNREKLAICIGIRKPGDYMDEQMVADVLSLNCELHLIHNVKPVPNVKANALLMQQRRMAYLTTFSENVKEQFDTALQWMDMSDADGQTLNDYAMSVMIFGDTKEELNFGQGEVEALCRLHNVTPVRDGWAAQAVFFSQFPTYDVYPRTFLFLSRVVACGVCIDKTAEGRQKSDWGPVPISYFRTITGTPYAFQFHVSEEAYAVAHTALIGPTGQGKTTFFSFMAGQAMRIPDLRTYFFDRNIGAKIFAMMQGAPYIKFDGGEESVSLNPFAIPDSPDNRAFLRTWLRDITGAKDAASEQEIARAVTTAFEYLRQKERLLRNLYKSCFAPNSFMRRELNRWIDEDQYGRVFNSMTDNLDLSSRYMAFDFTTIFQDATLAPAVISYVMHRIHTLATAMGTPSLIMIDETAPMLEHEMFKDSFIVGLREGRKKRQAFLCAFQQPKFLDDHGLGDVIRGQCQTVVFFRNPQANQSDYASWNLTPREMNFILGKEFADHKYAILVSRPAIHESVILDIDLSGLGPYLKIYSSGNKNVLLAEQLAKTYTDTDLLVQEYLKRA